MATFSYNSIFAHKLRLSVFLYILSVLQPTAFAVDVNTDLIPKVKKYSVFEITLTASGNYSNPYLKMPGDNEAPGFVISTFNGPNGEVFKIDGFWDGGKIWKVRMAPTAVGVWTYTTSSDDLGLNGKTGCFNCVASTSHGFIRIHPQNQFAFAYDDGTPFFWMGDTQVIFYHQNRKYYRFDNGTFQALQDLRVSQGITTLYFGSWLFKKKGNFAENEGGYNFKNSDPDLLNPSFWQWADKRLEYVVSKGMIPGLGIGWPDQGIKSFGEHRLMRAWRFMIARYAAYNVMWNLFGEVDEFGWRWKSRARYFGDAVKKFDPYGHVVSTHVTSRTAPYIGSDPWLDINVEQMDGWSAIISDRKRGKPVVNLEFGYEGKSSADELRRRAWGIIIHGGYFQYGDNLKPNTPGRTYCTYLAQFFTQKTDFWKLHPHNEIVTKGTGYCIANHGREYVIYLPFGGSIMIDLSAWRGTFNVVWYNPRTAEFIDQAITTGGVISSFIAPDLNDWVLHIKR